jgi:vesicle transport protein SEC22
MSNMDKLNTDLQDVTRIMTKNMEDLLWRGDSLDRESPNFSSTRHEDLLTDQAMSLTLTSIGMGQLSSSLKTESAKYKRAARNINLQALLRKWAPVGGIGLFTILFLWWRFF